MEVLCCFLSPEYLYVNCKEMLEGYKAVTITPEEDVNGQRSLYAQLEAVADMKFTYVATCQNYGNQKRQGDRHATDILNLMIKYDRYLLFTTTQILIVSSNFWIIWIKNLIFLFSNPSLRVAYIDEVEEKEGENIQKVYYSVLIKAVENLDQV